MINTFNAAGLTLIKSFENCEFIPYQDIKGVWTIGYGHTKDVNENTAPITQAEADMFLAEDLTNAELDVQDDITVPLNNNQYSALASLVFNCGEAPLLGHLGNYLNEGNYASAADAFLMWDHAKINGTEVVVPGLLCRRQAERELFLTPID